MKKIILFNVGIFCWIYINAQGLPKLELKQQSIIFPAFISGMMADQTAKYSGDTFVYQIPSQWFMNAPVALGLRSSPNLSTPFETVNELAKAFAEKNANQIIALYLPSERKQISELVNGKQGEELLTYYQGARNVVLLGAIQYRAGFMVYTKDDRYGVHENYITSKKGKYYITPLDDGKAATSWNLGLYLKHFPQPIYDLPTYNFPDSLSKYDSIKIECTVPAGNWVQVFYQIARQMIPYRIEDNGGNDLDTRPGKIMFFLKADMFPIQNGRNVFHITSTNFPVMYVAPTLLKLGRRYDIKIY